MANCRFTPSISAMSWINAALKSSYRRRAFWRAVIMISGLQPLAWLGVVKLPTSFRVSRLIFKPLQNMDIRDGLHAINFEGSGSRNYQADRTPTYTDRWSLPLDGALWPSS